MIRLATLALTLAIPVSAGSLKDAPAADLNSGTQGVREFWESLQEPPTPRAPVRTAPVPVPVPYVYVEGFQKRFRLPQALMDNYRLRVGQVISQPLARQLMKDLGAPYTPETMRFLNQTDPKETPQ